MDPEHNFDSDTSESWSVIDINDNEHNEHANLADLSDGFGTNTIPVTYQWSTSDTIINDNGGDDLHSQQYRNTVQDISTAGFANNPQGTASPSIEHPKANHDCQVLYKGKVFRDYNLQRKSGDFNYSKTSFSEAEKVEIDNGLKVSFSDFENDTDCISVISESECNDLKFSAYETDELWEEKLSESNIIGKNHQNVLKRKRKRLKLNYRGSSEESVSSDFKIPDGKYYSNIQNIEYKKSNNEMQVTEYQSAPVYKHYRNNVANTVLTLAMGVIFTGVACIAIGHFLGVHDAQHTAGEMMETLRRLQMENVLLHTRLAQLSRAFFSRGNSKLESPADVEPQNCLDRYLQQNIPGINENSPNDGNQIKNSIFFRGGSFDISMNIKEPSNELSYQEPLDYDKIKSVDKNHDRSNFCNVTKYEVNHSKAPYSSTTPIMFGYVFNEFSRSGEDVQGIKEKFVVDGQIKDRKTWKLFTENKHCIGTDEQFENGLDKQNCLAIREKDLSRFRWFLLQKKKKRNHFRWNEVKSENEDVGTENMYNFPQPEGYYKYKNEDRNDKRPDERLKLEEMCDELKLVRYPKDKDTSDFIDSTKSSPKGERTDDKFQKKKHSLKVKKEKKREKESKEEDNDLDDMKGSDSYKRREKFERKDGNSSKKIKDCEDNFSKLNKKYKTESTKKNGKLKECKKKGDRECNFKPHSKRSKNVAYSKEKRGEARRDEKNKEKYLKGEKVKKLAFEKEMHPRLNKRPRIFRGRKVFNVRPNMKFANQSNCEDCSNKTAAWLYKWAKGRESCRREHKMSEWQFDRARSRADSRIGDAFWQFKRALARESSRNEAYVHFRKRDTNNKRSSAAYCWI